LVVDEILDFRPSPAHVLQELVIELADFMEYGFFVIKGFHPLLN